MSSTQSTFETQPGAPAISASDSGTVRCWNHLLREATEEAAASLYRWSGGEVQLSLDEVHEVPLEEATAALPAINGLLTMVVLRFDEALGGSLIFTFDEVNSRRLVRILLGRDADAEISPELECSALMETGNIVGCAYLRRLADKLETSVVPSPPYYFQDFGASVLEQSLLEQAMTCDQVLVGRTEFRLRGETMNWHLFFIPGMGLRASVEKLTALPCL